MSELKGADLPPRLLNQLLPTVPGYGYEDTTVSHVPVPWETAQPLRYTIHTANPEMATAVIADITGSKLQAPEVLQTLSLVSVLDPLFSTERIDRSAIAGVRVVLDAATWSRPRTRIEDGLGMISDDVVPDNLQFVIEDSHKVPGIQIADLAAYSWARHRRKGDCESAVGAIHDSRFSTE